MTNSMYPVRVGAPSLDQWVTFAVLLRVRTSAQAHLHRQNEALAVVSRINERENPPTWYVVVQRRMSEAVAFMAALPTPEKRVTTEVLEAALFDTLQAAQDACVQPYYFPAPLSEWIIPTQTPETP